MHWVYQVYKLGKIFFQYMGENVVSNIQQYMVSRIYKSFDFCYAKLHQ